MTKYILSTIALTYLTACMAPETNGLRRNFAGSMNGCPERSAMAQSFMTSVNDLPIRCGPQNIAPMSYR